MCGRFTLTVSDQQIMAGFGLDAAPDGHQPRYNIAPTQPVGVITNMAPKQLSYVQWGLVPHWSKDPSVASKLINARSETAHEKPSFRDSMIGKRCLIPADGFYEWQASGKQKTPMYIFLPDRDLFAFAGLWSTWQSPTGQVIESCTILTTDANDRLHDIHHRMPVILQPGDYETWLQADSVDTVRPLLKPYASDEVDAYPVSTRVNKVENDSPSNIKRDSGPAQQLPLF